jgi:hypothetical protein
MKKITKNPDNTEPVVGGPVVANHFDVHDGTVRRWRRQGMPSHAYGRKLVRYKLSEVESWLNQRSVSKTAPEYDRSGLRNQAVAK